MSILDTLVVFGEGGLMDPQTQQSGIFVLAIFLAVLAERGWQWLLRRRARQWPGAQGRVHRVDWRQPRTGTNRYFIGDLSYYYFVGGQYYAGYHRRSFSTAAEAGEWVRQMQGADIQVRYKASAPGCSMMLQEDQLRRADAVSVGERSELVIAD